MIRSAASKVMWVGRATVFLVGLAVILALVFGVASTALGKNGQALILGKANNVATKMTGVIGKVASGSALVVKNPSGGSALGLQVSPDQAPLTVNAEAGKATNLNADQLDGLDSADLRLRTGVYEVSKVHDGMANMTTFDAVSCDDGDEVLAGGFIGLSSGARVIASIPQLNDTWAIGLESGSTAGSVNMYVQCYDFPPAHAQ